MCKCGHSKDQHFNPDPSFTDPNTVADDYEEDTEFCFNCDCEEFTKL